MLTSSDTRAEQRHKRLAILASLAMIGAVLWPLRQNWCSQPRDSFPLSYYPMFSARRKQREQVIYLVGHDSARQPVPISYRYAGAGGLNQVRRQIRRTVAEGRADLLCQLVAAAIARDPHLRTVATVQVVTGSFRLADYYKGRVKPIREIVHAEAPVCREAPAGQ